ncbi:MAG: flagellin [Oscillospiraceae bacterium]|nr:flagellin [Oscillospiraceae bacterium]
MRIQHNIMAMNAYRNLSGNQNALSKNLEKLSSGYKINRAGDDAAGLAISEKMRAQITGLEAAQKNVKDGIGLIKTAEGALQEVQDMMNRMVYLAEQSANGTYDEKVDRAALEDEVKALTAEINRIGETANFNGQKLLNGDLTKVSFQIGDSNAAGDKLAMSGIIGTKASQATIVDLTKAISVATQTKAQTAIDTLKGAAANPENGLINKISSLRGKLGATQNRLEHTSNNLGVMRENIQDAESNIRDTDVADEMMKYTKNNILVQSAQAMLAQANQVPQGVLQLMQ